MDQQIKRDEEKIKVEQKKEEEKKPQKTLEPQILEKLQDQLEKENRELTLKQTKFLQEYIRTGNATEAAMIVYDCNNRVTAGALGYETLKKLQTSDLLEGIGLTKKAILQTVMMGVVKPTKMENKLVKVKKTLKKGDKTVTIIKEELRPVEVPDYAVRHKYIQDVLKMQKLLTNDSSSGDKFNAENINFVWNSEQKLDKDK